MINKKAIGPVVAMSLFVLLSVSAVIGFQNWFGQYSSSSLSEVEKTGNVGNVATKVDSIVGNDLYFQNKKGKSINVLGVKVDGADCNVSGIYNDTMINFNVSLCMENMTPGIKEVLVITDEGLYSKKEFISSAYKKNEVFLKLNLTTYNFIHTSIGTTFLKISDDVVATTNSYGFSILNISDPTNVKIINSVGDSAYYSSPELHYSDGLLYVGNSYSDKLSIYNITDLNDIKFINEYKNSTMDGIEVITVKDNLLFAKNSDGIIIFNSSDPSDLKIVGSNTSIFDDFFLAEGDIMYAARNGYFSIYNISDYNHIKKISSLNVGSPIKLILQWEKVGDLIMFGDHWAHTYAIINVSDINNPVLENYYHNSSLFSSTNKARSNNNFGFVAATGNDSLVILNVTDKSNITLSHIYNFSGGIGNVYLNDDVLFLTSNSSFISYNISDIKNIIEIGRYDYRLHDIRAFEIKNNLLYAITAKNRFFIIDISKPYNHKVLFSYYNESLNYPQYIQIKDNYAYITSSDEKLFIFDITQSTNSYLYSSYNISTSYSPNSLFNEFFLTSLKINEDIGFYLSSISDRVYILNISDLTNITQVSNFSLGDPREMILDGDIGYIYHSSGVNSYNISNLSNIIFLDNSIVSFRINDFYKKDDLIYAISKNYDRLDIFNISNTSNIVLSNSIIDGTTLNEGRAVILIDNYLFIPYRYGVTVWNISNPTNPNYLESHTGFSTATDMKVWGNYGYVSGDYGFINVFQIFE